MLCLPAERVCCGCVGVYQAASAICFYYSFTGIVAMVGMIANMGSNAAAASDHGKSTEGARPQLKPISQFLLELGLMYRMVGLLFGSRGYAGIVTRQATQVRYALMYTISYCCVILLSLLRLPTLCEEFPEVNCSNLKAVLAASVGFEFYMFTYFAYVLWSCSEKIAQGVSDVLPRFLLDESLVNTRELSYESPTRGTAPIPGQIEPFSGQGHRLE
ncbi:unnamed protein product [Amoebophrya sp. A25]|nr:unnamed protein product [Amoebophrya sp. A25]|eukprot:GSA25T00002768001.1